jgi:hypothetical protein
MNDRIHRHLDGELPEAELTPEEREEARAYASILEEAGSLLREEGAPDVTHAVMSRIASGRTETRGGWWSAFWEPRTIRIRPVYGALAAAAVLLVVLLPKGGERTAATDFLAPSATVAAPPGTVLVQFRLDLPEASSVRLAGTFTGWAADVPLHRMESGTWSVALPLPPGIHDYGFLVDGDRWVPDPTTPRVEDGFGGENSRLTLLFTNGWSES